MSLRQETFTPTAYQASIANLGSNKINILCTGAGAGNTTALLLKAYTFLAEKTGQHVVFINRLHKQAEVLAEDFHRMFGGKLSRHSLIVELPGKNKVKFAAGADSRVLGDLVIYEDLGMITVHRITEALSGKTVIWGYESPYLYSPCAPENLQEYAKSFDSEDEFEEFLKNKYPVLYKLKGFQEDVQLISGYGVEDNPYLYKSEPKYVKLLKGFPGVYSGSWT